MSRPQRLPFRAGGLMSSCLKKKCWRGRVGSRTSIQDHVGIAENVWDHLGVANKLKGLGTAALSNVTATKFGRFDITFFIVY